MKWERLYFLRFSEQSPVHNNFNPVLILLDWVDEKKEKKLKRTGSKRYMLLSGHRAKIFSQLHMYVEWTNMNLCFVFFILLDFFNKMLSQIKARVWGSAAEKEAIHKTLLFLRQLWFCVNQQFQPPAPRGHRAQKRAEWPESVPTLQVCVCRRGKARRAHGQTA